MSTLTASPMRRVQREVGEDWDRSPLGLYMPPRVKRRYDLPVAVDLFAGAGGFGLGFHEAGFHVAAASDSWGYAALTYMVNLAQPGVRMHFDTDERESEFAKLAAKSMGMAADADGNITGPDPKRRGIEVSDDIVAAEARRYGEGSR